MGIITNFFIKKVKDEEKKFAKKYHGKYTKRELMQMSANSVLKKTILTGGVAVTCIAAGVIGYCLSKRGKEVTSNDYNKIIEESTKLVEDDVINQTNDISSKIDEISTHKEALSYIKDMYIEEYNRVNNTKYTSDEIEFKSSNENYVYDLDGIYVTHGSTPNDVKNKLEKDNESYEIKDNVKVYSSYLVNDSKKSSLESFAVSDKMIVNVLLGDEYVKGKEINYDDTNTLVDMYRPITTGIDLVLDFSNGKSDIDIQIRKNNLKDAIYQYQREHSEQNKEIDEIGG